MNTTTTTRTAPKYRYAVSFAYNGAAWVERIAADGRIVTGYHAYFERNSYGEYAGVSDYGCNFGRVPQDVPEQVRRMLRTAKAEANRKAGAERMRQQAEELTAAGHYLD